MIKIDNISKKYDGKNVLENFSYIFPDKGFYVISGKSGTGKTTLLNIIMGIETPDKGNIIFSHEKNSALKEESSEKECVRISAVFQEDRLLEYETALENVLFVMDDSNNKEQAERNKTIAAEILRSLGLEKDMQEKASKLSGGMKRRVAIGRCLAHDADIYIMDEPIKGLDEATARSVLETIHQNTDQKDKLLIMVTHNKEDGIGCADIIDFNCLL